MEQNGDPSACRHALLASYSPAPPSRGPFFWVCWYAILSTDVCSPPSSGLSFPLLFEFSPFSPIV